MKSNLIIYIFNISILLFLYSCLQKKNIDNNIVKYQKTEIYLEKVYFSNKRPKNLLQSLKTYCSHSENGKRIQIGKGFEGYYVHKPNNFDLELLFDNSSKKFNGSIQIEIHELQFVQYANDKNLKHIGIGDSVNNLDCIQHKNIWVGNKILYEYFLDSTKTDNKIIIKHIDYKSPYQSSLFYSKHGFRVVASFKSERGEKDEYLVEEFVCPI